MHIFLFMHTADSTCSLVKGQYMCQLSSATYESSCLGFGYTDLFISISRMKPSLVNEGYYRSPQHNTRTEWSIFIDLLIYNTQSQKAFCGHFLISLTKAKLHWRALLFTIWMRSVHNPCVPNQIRLLYPISAMLTAVLAPRVIIIESMTYWKSRLWWGKNRFTILIKLRRDLAWFRNFESLWFRNFKLV